MENILRFVTMGFSWPGLLTRVVGLEKLLRAMLRPDPDQRLTAWEAQKDPYFTVASGNHSHTAIEFRLTCAGRPRDRIRYPHRCTVQEDSTDARFHEYWFTCFIRNCEDTFHYGTCPYTFSPAFQAGDSSEPHWKNAYVSL